MAGPKNQREAWELLRRSVLYDSHWAIHFDEDEEWTPAQKKRLDWAIEKLHRKLK